MKTNKAIIKSMQDKKNEYKIALFKACVSLLVENLGEGRIVLAEPFVMTEASVKAHNSIVTTQTLVDAIKLIVCGRNDEDVYAKEIMLYSDTEPIGFADSKGIAVMENLYSAIVKTIKAE
jgi:predicted nucleic acid-binding protein